MKELSLHILDIVQNSIKAGAKNIEILINESTADNLMTIEINDNGCGMSEEFLKKVKDPFVTTRTTRKMGMGISLFDCISDDENRLCQKVGRAAHRMANDNEIVSLRVQGLSRIDERYII